MRICILAYDGLEYDLVKKFDLRNLKQKEYGRTDISDFVLSATSLIWPSFYTGKNMQDYLLNLPKWRIEFLNKIIKASLSLSLWQRFTSYRVRGMVERWLYLWKEVLIDKRITRTSKIMIDKDFRTFFDFFPNSKIIGMPNYSKSENVLCEEDKLNIKKVFHGEITEETYKKRVWKLASTTKRKLLKSLNKYDLVACYFSFADSLGHLFRGTLNEIKEIYEKLDLWTEEIKSKVEPNTFLLIISDHGMEPLGRYGSHMYCKYGFYSSNIELGLNNPKITDFYDVIKNIKLRWKS